MTTSVFKTSGALEVKAIRIQSCSGSHETLKGEVAAMLTMKHQAHGCCNNAAWPANPPTTVNTRH